MENTYLNDNLDHKLSELSRREIQVIEKIMEGLPNKTIAAQLFISERTVKFHCANIYRKLGIPNRATLMARFFRLKLTGHSHVAESKSQLLPQLIDSVEQKKVNAGNLPSHDLTPGEIIPPIYFTQALGEDGGDIPNLI